MVQLIIFLRSYGMKNRSIHVSSLPVPFYAFQLSFSVLCSHPSFLSSTLNLWSWLSHFPLTAIHVSHILIQHLWSNTTAKIYWAFSECQALSWALEKSTQSILKITQGNKESDSIFDVWWLAAFKPQPFSPLLLHICDMKDQV